MDREELIAKLEELNLTHVNLIKKFIKYPKNYSLKKEMVVFSPNALMGYLKEALRELSNYIESNKLVAKKDAHLKWDWEMAVVSHSKLNAAWKELKARHKYGGIFNRFSSKGGEFR
jgi:hypothetical protein